MISNDHGALWVKVPARSSWCDSIDQLCYTSCVVSHRLAVRQPRHAVTPDLRSRAAALFVPPRPDGRIAGHTAANRGPPSDPFTTVAPSEVHSFRAACSNAVRSSSPHWDSPRYRSRARGWAYHLRGCDSHHSKKAERHRAFSRMRLPAQVPRYRAVCFCTPPILRGVSF